MSVELLYGKRFLIDKEFAREYSYSRLEYILGKPVDSIEFPMGMRPWKVNTVLSLDGFRVAITGIGNNGKTLLIQGVTQFASNNECTYYLSKLEKLSKKFKNNAKYIYDEEFDIVSKARNLELYDLYLKKYKESIYSKRINKPLEIIENGRTDFEKLSVLEQVDMLLNIHSTFGRSGASGVDLGKIGGSPRCAATSFSANVSNWNKQYKDVRIIDMSPSGLWERQSMNLLEL